MTSCYATRTEVPADSSRAEIKCIRVCHGTDDVPYGWNDEFHRAALSFRQVRCFMCNFISLPTRNAFWSAENVKTRTSAICDRSTDEQAIWRRWRALARIINPGMEASEVGLSALEQESLARGLFPNDQTIGEGRGLQIAQVYAGSQLPRSLPDLPKPGHQRPTREAA